MPQGPTTKSSNRKIAFALLHAELFPEFSTLTLDQNVPWGPHYGLCIEVDQSPLLVTGNVLCSPRDLPMANSNNIWTNLNQCQQYKNIMLRASSLQTNLPNQNAEQEWPF